MHLQVTASRAAALLAKDPSLFCKVMIAKLNSARPMPPLPAQRRIHGVVFECDDESYRGTAPMYFGSYAPLVVAAMSRILQLGDIFIDVGANVGYLSAIAAGLVGPAGAVHCFEPVATYFRRLQRLSELNPRFAIIPNACALGEASGSSTIYVTHESGQSTLVPRYKGASQIKSQIVVPVLRLDSYVEAHSIDRIALIKVDVEGFELPVLRGLEGYFRGSRHRPPIICEIAPRAYPLLGFRISDLEGFMRSWGYCARDLIDGSTPVDIRTFKHVDDVLFVADQK